MAQKGETARLEGWWIVPGSLPWRLAIHPAALDGFYCLSPEIVLFSAGELVPPKPSTWFSLCILGDPHEHDAILFVFSIVALMSL